MKSLRNSRTFYALILGEEFGYLFVSFMTGFGFEATTTAPLSWTTRVLLMWTRTAARDAIALELVSRPCSIIALTQISTCSQVIVKCVSNHGVKWNQKIEKVYLHDSGFTSNRDRALGLKHIFRKSNFVWEFSWDHASKWDDDLLILHFPPVGVIDARLFKGRCNSFEGVTPH